MDVTPEPTNLLSQLKKLLRGPQHTVAQIRGRQPRAQAPRQRQHLASMLRGEIQAERPGLQPVSHVEKGMTFLMFQIN